VDEEFTAFGHENRRRLLRVAELLTGDRGRVEAGQPRGDGLASHP
jgi:hypothetical protein